MNGFELLTELRARPEWRGIPVVVVTARDLTPEERQRLNGHVEKILARGALGPEALLAEVRELVAASLTRRRGTPRPADRLPSEDRLPGGSINGRENPARRGQRDEPRHALPALAAAGLRWLTAVDGESGLALIKSETPPSSSWT